RSVHNTQPQFRKKKKEGRKGRNCRDVNTPRSCNGRVTLFPIFPGTPSERSPCGDARWAPGLCDCELVRCFASMRRGKRGGGVSLSGSGVRRTGQATGRGCWGQGSPPSQKKKKKINPQTTRSRWVAKVPPYLETHTPPLRHTPEGRVLQMGPWPHGGVRGRAYGRKQCPF